MRKIINQSRLSKGLPTISIGALSCIFIGDYLKATNREKGLLRDEVVIVDATNPLYSYSGFQKKEFNLAGTGSSVSAPCLTIVPVS